MKHENCETCRCDNPSNLTVLNNRCHRLLIANPIEIPEILRSRLAESPFYVFGFDDFIGDRTTNCVTAIFRHALMPKGPSSNWQDEVRFYAVVTVDPDVVPRPFEFKKGDSFPIPEDATTGWSLTAIAAMTDADLLAWLDRHRIYLRDYVEQQVTVHGR
jgi:hypothetical protein